jgi:hypothetical protein
MSGMDPNMALEALSLAYGGLVALLERFGEADSDRERRSLLISIISQAWHVRDAAASAYAALEYQADADGLARGVLE